MKSIYQRFVKRTLFVILFGQFALLSNAITYYVSNSGNDSNSGLTTALAWKTISKVNSFAFQPDDSVLFKGGDVWEVSYYLYKTNPRLTLAASAGTNGHPVVVSSYGTGMAEITGHIDLASVVYSGNYIISSWTQPEVWSEYSSGIWRIMIGDIAVRRLWANGKELKKAQNIASISNTNPFRSDGGFLYLKCSSNPATFFNSLKCSNSDSKLITMTVDNVILSNIKVTGAAIVISNCSNVTIEHCEIGFKANSGGISVYSNNNSTLSDNIVIRHNEIITGDSINQTFFEDPHATGDAINLGSGSTNCKIYNNFFSGWSHSAVYMYAPDGSLPFHGNEVYNNYITAPLIDYARGFNATTYSNGYNNSFHHNYLHDLSVGNQFNSPNLKVYDNIIDGIRDQTYGGRKTGGHGISISAQFVDAVNMEIYNNTVMNCITAGFVLGGQAINPNKSYMNVHDNNFINNGFGQAAGTGYQFQIWFNGLANIDHVSITNNHMIGSSADVVNYSTQENYSANAMSSLTVSEFNALPVINNNVFSGNDSILTYNIPGIGKYATNVNDLKIERNGSALSKTVSLVSPMIDLKGTKYSQSITLQPYTAVLLLKDNSAVPILFTEYKTICEGTSYNGWTVSGEYERTLIAKSGSDSIVTTILTVNPKYAITEDITINEGEEYRGWTATGKYSRTLISVSGCDSIITTNLTVVSSTIKQGSITPTHFIPVWQGENGLNHMNFMVVSASLEDLPLSPEDEIAVFSGETCVGSSMLSQIINPSDNSTFLTFQASQDDGSNNGFVDNDTIQFKIWDKANQREMIANAVVYRKDVSSWISSGKFAAGSTAVVEIVSYTEYTQSISLLKGYNMISTYLSTSDPDVVSVTKSLNDDGSLIKIQDETGNSFENWGSFGGWINNLGSIQTTEGYKIKVANNCILQVTGRPIALPLDITLKSGWNIISFPRTDFVDAMSIIESLINQNKLIKVQDEKGNSIENWGAYGGWKNGIGNFLPGKAYKVKMNTDAILTIQEHYTKSAVIMAKAEETKYFSTDIEGNGSDHMNINLIGLIESGLSTGDELAAFDGELCVGTLKLTEDHLVQNSASLVTSFSTDDQYKSGFKVGNRIQIYIWNQESGNESEVQAEPVSGQLNFEKNASVWAKLKSATTGAKTGIEDLVSIDLFPNPSTGKVTVRFSTLPDDTNSRIEILDLSGRRITTRQITGTSEEFNLLQQPKGIYLVKTILGTDETVNKLIIN